MVSIYFMHFIVSSFAASVIILLFLLVKKTLKHHISGRWLYNIDLLFFVLMSIPLIPVGLLNFLSLKNWGFSDLHFGQMAKTGMANLTERVTPSTSGMSWLQDFTMSVDRTTPGAFAPFFMILWILGVAVIVLFTLFANQKIRIIKESTKPIDDEALLVLFQRCKAELRIKRNVLVGTSVLVRSPMTIGLFRSRILLPADVRETLSIEEIRYILLHELTHCKNKDNHINSLMCLFQIIYWFNPFIFLAFREMRLDRELACDLSVLNRIPQENYINYGKTLLKFVQKRSFPTTPSFSTEMGGSKAQIKKRIEGIVSVKTESKWLKVKSIFVFVLAGLLVFSQIPTISALASYDEGKYHFNANNVVYEDLSSFFDGFEGSFVLYDMKADSYTIHDRDKSVTRVSPASTYKIYSALIALETGIIDMDRSEEEWNGITYPFEVWNQDQNLLSAMQNSVSWYFQNLDAKVGLKTLSVYYNRLPYGNCDLSGGTSDYWMESSLRISPVEQVRLMKDFYLNETIFKSEHVNTLKAILRLSEKDGAVLSGKTGTGSVNGKVINGWFVGYVENDGRTFIFATNIQGKDHAGGSAAVKVTLEILQHKHIY